LEKKFVIIRGGRQGDKVSCKIQLPDSGDAELENFQSRWVESDPIIRVIAQKRADAFRKGKNEDYGVCSLSMTPTTTTSRWKVE